MWRGRKCKDPGPGKSLCIREPEKTAFPKHRKQEGRENSFSAGSDQVEILGHGRNVDFTPSVTDSF